LCQNLHSSNYKRTVKHKLHRRHKDLPWNGIYYCLLYLSIFVYFFIRFAYTYKQYSLYCGCTKLWYSLYCGCTKLVITSWRLQLRHSATTKPGNNCHLIMFNGYYIWKVFFHIYVKLTVFFSSACGSGRTRTVYFGVLAKVDVSYKMKLKIAIEIKITMQITFLLLLFIYNLFENAFQRKLF
jgi:hypothetical protein